MWIAEPTPDQFHEEGSRAIARIRTAVPTDHSMPESVERDGAEAKVGRKETCGTTSGEIPFILMV
jgi:hypothetical protein